MATAFCVTLNKRSQSVKRGWKEEKNMVKLYDKGVYLLNGTEIAEDARQVEQKTGQKISREEAVKQTMAYRILESHNTHLAIWNGCRLEFDKLTSHDITFVGIIQTARASGLEKFPIPYVLTNCHNTSVCSWRYDQ